MAWVSGLVGLLTALLVWWLALVWRSRTHHRSAVNATLPWWWRCLWPVAVCFGAASPRVVSSVTKPSRVTTELQTLGLRDVGETQLRAVQWAALLVCAVPLSVLSWWWQSVMPLLLLAWAWFGPLWWLHVQSAARRQSAVRALPFALDMMTLCLEAGLHFQGAVQQTVERGPQGPLRDELQHWLGEVRAGVSRVEALRGLALRLDHPAVRGWVQVMIQADGMGMSLGGVLRAQAEQRRTERFILAEKRALQAPVRMLFPLVLCIFPCSFLVLAFPVGVQLLESLS